MAPPTRRNPLRTPSPEPLAGNEATTTRKCKFFDALARSGGSKSLRRISVDCQISEACGRKWKKQLEDMGSLAKRKTRQRSQVLGRKSKVTKSMCKTLVSPTRNPVRKQPYEAQISYHKLPVQKRQLKRKLKEHTKGGGRYMCAFVRKVISAQNYASRVTYGEAHLYDPLFGFFDHIVYTDEAHVDPTSQAQGMVLREQGKRDDPEISRKGLRSKVSGFTSPRGSLGGEKQRS
jgi:hypothetical protein